MAIEIPASQTVTVAVDNIYECGRISDSVEHVRYPLPDESIEDWFGNVVFDVTGDGHSCGWKENATYEAEVTDAPLLPDLVGEKWSWG